MDKICRQVTKMTENLSSNIKDYTRFEILGEGSFSFVYKAISNETQQLFSLKELSKSHVVKNNKVNSVKNEKEILQKLRGQTSIVRLETTMQDSSSLYFLLEYLPGGDLCNLIQRNGTLTVDSIKTCLSQIIVSLEVLHSRNIVHRDIKPENFVFSETRHLKLVDFGTSIQLQSNTDRTKVFDGTPEYIAPELLILKSSGLNSDLWGFGLVAYFLYFGKHPFRGSSEYFTYSNIKNNDLFIPEGEHPPIFMDLLTSLLKKDENERLGKNGNIHEIKSHPFFENVDWNSVFEVEPSPLIHSDVVFDFSHLNVGGE